jgi:hypothetical protein
MKKNTGKRTFQPCVRDCRVKPTAFRRGLATESLTVPQERPKEKESPEHSSGGIESTLGVFHLSTGYYLWIGSFLTLLLGEIALFVLKNKIG